MVDTSKRHYVYQSLFLVASICLNLPPVALGVMGCFQWCKYFASWLAANAALTMANAVAALYIINEVRKAETSENETASAARNIQNSTHRSPSDQSAVATSSCIEQGSSQIDNSQQQLRDLEETLQVQPETQRKCCLCFVHTSHSKHLRHLIRYDCFVSTYCIFLIFWLFWLADGVERIIHIDEVDVEDLENCSGFHEDYVLYSFSMGFVYFAITIISVLMVHLPDRRAGSDEEKSAIDA